MLRKYVHYPTLVCAQRRAEKCIPTEEDFIRTNINSFGNDIGQITNRVTSMYDVRVKFEPDSEEYKVLSYRIQSGQQYQQDRGRQPQSACAVMCMNNNLLNCWKLLRA